MDVKDKIIVVTGAASGIGVALVKRFYAAGAKHIVSVDINLDGAKATAAEFGGTAMQADVALPNGSLLRTSTKVLVSRCCARKRCARP